MGGGPAPPLCAPAPASSAGIWGVVALGLAVSAHEWTLASLFAYGGLLCVDQGWARDADSAGYTAGFLAGALTLGRIPTAALWGRIADARGVRTCVVASMASLAVGNLAFGLARSLRVAIALRCVLLGSMNGLVTLFAPTAAEVAVGLDGGSFTGVFSQAFAMGGCVSVLAPYVGGLAYGTLAPASFPALAPSVVGAAIAVAAAVAAFKWLPRRLDLETAHPPAYAKLSLVEKEEAEDDDNDEALLPDGGTRRGSKGGLARLGGAPPASGAGAPPPQSAAALLVRYPLALVAGMRFVYGLELFASFDLIPLWAISSRRVGGLGWRQRRLGSMLGAAALAFVPWTYLAVPVVVRRLGVRGAALAASIALVPAYAATPACTRFATAWAANVALSLANALMEPTLNAATMDAAPEACRGAVNGLVTTLEAIAKALGPPAAATLYAWSISRRTDDDEHTAPSHERHAVSFYVLAALAALLAPAACALPRDRQHPGKPQQSPHAPTRAPDDDDNDDDDSSTIIEMRRRPRHHGGVAAGSGEPVVAVLRPPTNLGDDRHPPLTWTPASSSSSGS